MGREPVRAEPETAQRARRRSVAGSHCLLLPLVCELIRSQATGVAGLLGPDAEFRTSHESGGYREDGSGFGCEVLITQAGDVWSLHRGDSVWSMTRESEGRRQPDGRTLFSSWIDLAPTPTTSHPQHLAAEVRAALLS
ncbi:hypothetical protein GCM10009716_21390 [Streptomyces sodiiphilus]|uniref:Uncharacterized protein n=1 Tax=Streptomyces sodiiphilus TaxID=226217 RepID=A0ABN2P351_9ACTN